MSSPLTTTRSKRSVYRQPNKEVPKNQGIVSVALAYCRRGRLWLARRTKRLPYLSRSIGQFAYTPNKVLCVGALTDESYRVPPLLEPLITNRMVKQDAHEIAYFRFDGVRYAVSVS